MGILHSCLNRVDEDDKVPDSTRTGNISQEFAFSDLETATENFSETFVIGSGGFGPVYKGILENNGQVVAVKRLNQMGDEGHKEFLREIIILPVLQHANIINLVGFCSVLTDRLLVYEYMPLRSLDRHLHDRTLDMEPLSWNLRISIAFGVATALCYLHSLSFPVVFLGVKSSNVLLDDGYHPKISDFGSADRALFGRGFCAGVLENDGYNDPHYDPSCNWSLKLDVYSFGVLLLELISGRKALDEQGARLTDWAHPMLKHKKLMLVDPLLKSDFSKHALFEAVELVELCLGEVDKRPSMGEVLEKLTSLQLGSKVTSSSNTAKSKEAASSGTTEESKEAAFTCTAESKVAESSSTAESIDAAPASSGTAPSKETASYATSESEAAASPSTAESEEAESNEGSSFFSIGGTRRNLWAEYVQYERNN